MRNAAPKVAAFLHGNNDLFARIVDAIIENTAREKGLLPSVQRAVDQLVLIWTEQSKRKQSNEDNDQEIDPNVFNNLPYLAGQRNTLRTPMLRAISPSTPAAVLCRLLALMTRLRCLVHACYHAMIGQGLRQRIKHLPERALYASISGPRFRNCRQGISYTPADVGPLIRIEEQRLLGSFLCIIFYDKVRKMDADVPVLSARSETIHISPDRRRPLEENLRGA